MSKKIVKKVSTPVQAPHKGMDAEAQRDKLPKFSTKGLLYCGQVYGPDLLYEVFENPTTFESFLTSTPTAEEGSVCKKCGLADYTKAKLTLVSVHKSWTKAMWDGVILSHKPLVAMNREVVNAAKDKLRKDTKAANKVAKDELAKAKTDYEQAQAAFKAVSKNGKASAKKAAQKVLETTLKRFRGLEAKAKEKAKADKANAA
jgi:hypothetical protein